MSDVLVTEDEELVLCSSIKARVTSYTGGCYSLLLMFSRTRVLHEEVIVHLCLMDSRSTVVLLVEVKQRVVRPDFFVTLCVVKGSEIRATKSCNLSRNIFALRLVE